jgi:hypothetical protein
MKHRVIAALVGTVAVIAGVVGGQQLLQTRAIPGTVEDFGWNFKTFDPLDQGNAGDTYIRNCCVETGEETSYYGTIVRPDANWNIDAVKILAGVLDTHDSEDMWVSVYYPAPDVAANGPMTGTLVARSLSVNTDDLPQMLDAEDDYLQISPTTFAFTQTLVMTASQNYLVVMESEDAAAPYSYIGWLGTDGIAGVDALRPSWMPYRTVGCTDDNSQCWEESSSLYSAGSLPLALVGNVADDDDCALGPLQFTQQGYVACWNPYADDESGTFPTVYRSQPGIYKDAGSAMTVGHYVLPAADWTINRVEMILGYEYPDGNTTKAPIYLRIYVDSGDDYLKYLDGDEEDTLTATDIIWESEDLAGIIPIDDISSGDAYSEITSIAVEPAVTLQAGNSYVFMIESDGPAGDGNVYYSHAMTWPYAPYTEPSYAPVWADHGYGYGNHIECSGYTGTTLTYCGTGGRAFPIALYGSTSDPNGGGGPTMTPGAATSTPTSTPIGTPTLCPGCTRVPATVCADFYADQDTYVAEEAWGLSYGISNTLDVQHPVSEEHQAFARFNLSGIAALSDVRDSSLLAYTSAISGTNPIIRVGEVFSDTWTESMTWMTGRPLRGDQLSYYEITSVATPRVTFEGITPWTQLQVDTDKYASLMLYSDVDVDSATFHSRESAYDPNLYTCWTFDPEATPTAGPTPTLRATPTAGGWMGWFTEILTERDAPCRDWNGRSGCEGDRNDAFVEFTTFPYQTLSGWQIEVGDCTYTLSEDNYSGPLKVIWLDNFYQCAAYALDGTMVLKDPNGDVQDTRYYFTFRGGDAYRAAAWTYPEGVWISGTPMPGH